MIIYLDESKRLWKWEIVIWWFFSYHNTHYIDNFIKYKKKKLNIIENIELKSTNKFWKSFINMMSNDEDFWNLDIKTFWFHFKNYFFDSSETYMNLLLEILVKIIESYWKKYSTKITIVHDNINASNNKIVSKKIEKILKNIWFSSEFKIHNSQKYLSLQLADLIVWEYKKLYFFDDVKSLDDYLLEKNFAK